MASTYAPDDISQLYNFPSGARGKGQCVAFIDLAAHGSDQGQGTSSVSGQAAELVKVDVFDPRSTDESEDRLDTFGIAIAAALVPEAKFVSYSAPNTDEGFFEAVTAAIYDATLQPSIIVISWGSPENLWTGQSLRALNDAFEIAAALGTTILVSAGSEGATSGVNDGELHVEFPASSPYVTACGRTRVTIRDGRIIDEVVWAAQPGQGAAGGGVSAEFTIPNWQKGIGVPASPSGPHVSGRGVPDIAGNGDYEVCVGGRKVAVTGSSAPLFAGLVARLNELLGRPTGFLNPVIYALPSSSRAFWDVVVGGNEAYSAVPGWDAPSGLGRPIGTNLLNALVSTRD
jgi:kumamolisin